MPAAEAKVVDPRPSSADSIEGAERHVPYVNMAVQWAEERDELLPIVERVLAEGHWVGGSEIEELEEALARLCGVSHAVALNSGTDALAFGMAALGIAPGDEVITPPNSFIASTAAIVQLGARPVFVDVGDDQNIDPDRVESAITPNTKAIMPVHLTGRIADMAPILEIAERHALWIVEDAAQSIGSRYDGRMSGGFGQVGCFSTHPLKNLNACGDGGFLTTGDESVAEAVRALRNHGLVTRDTVARFGHVSRMDSLQAAILRFRLSRLDDTIERRRANAALYRERLDPSHVFVPAERERAFDTYHTFVIQVDRRDALQAFLRDQGIGTTIHYPVPIHLQPAAAELGHRAGDFPVTERQAERILTLPINQTLSSEDVVYVADRVNAFFRS
jgi:dTDP-4-amino-4,6-dideoxygalactose transaminase